MAKTKSLEDILKKAESKARKKDGPKILSHSAAVDPNDVDYAFFIGWVRLEAQHKQPMSAYSIWKHVEKKIALKNVNIKTRRLYEYGLLEKTGEEALKKFHIRSVHSAIYYQVSDKGWFNLVLNGDVRYQDICRAVIAQYDRSLVGKTFLEPYFEYKTIAKGPLILLLSEYLTDCCQPDDIKNVIKNIKSRHNLRPSKWEEFKAVQRSLPKMMFEGLTAKVHIHLVKFMLRVATFNSPGHPEYAAEMLRALRADKKFMKKLPDLKKEFEGGYSRF